MIRTLIEVLFKNKSDFKAIQINNTFSSIRSYTDREIIYSCLRKEHYEHTESAQSYIGLNFYFNNIIYIILLFNRVRMFMIMTFKNLKNTRIKCITFIQYKDLF